MDSGTMLAAGGMALAGVVWLVRLEGRINVNEKVSDEKFLTIQNDVSEIKTDVKELLKR